MIQKIMAAMLAVLAVATVEHESAGQTTREANLHGMADQICTMRSVPWLSNNASESYDLHPRTELHDVFLRSRDTPALRS